MMQKESSSKRLPPFNGDRNWKWLLAFYLGLAIVTGAVSFFSRPIKIEEAAYLQRRVWVGLGTYGAAKSAPDIIYRVNSTRILVPALIAGFVRITGRTWETGFSLLRLVFIALAYLTFHWYLRGWFPSSLAMLGTLFVAATIPLTFNNYIELPTDFPELLTYTLGLWCIREQRYKLLYLIIAVGTLNRETTAFLPLILLLCVFDRSAPWRGLPMVMIAGLAWLLPWAGLRWWVGIGGQWHGIYGDSFTHNLIGIAQFFKNLNPYNNYLFYLYLFGVFWALPFVYWRQQPPFLRRVLLSVPVFVSVYVLLGFWDEPREIVNLYPLLVPMGLFALFGGESLSETDAVS